MLRVLPDRDGETLRAEVVPIPRTLEHAVATGAITGETPSLFGAMAAAGERPDLAIAIADVFSGEIDFVVALEFFAVAGGEHGVGDRDHVVGIEPPFLVGRGEIPADAHHRVTADLEVQVGCAAVDGNLQEVIHMHDLLIMRACAPVI